MHLDVRRLAAIDMHGTTGSLRRRRVIRAEFVAGAVLCVGLGVLSLATARAILVTLFGIWLIGVGLNYATLAAHAVALSRRGALQEELNDVDVAGELSYCIRAQFWIAVPLAVVLLSTRTRPRHISR